MQRFILRQNVHRFRKLLSEEGTDDRTRRTIESLLREAQRELAVLESARSGVRPDHLQRARAMRPRASNRVGRFSRQFEDACGPSLLLDPGPGLRIVDLNDAYAQATMTAAADVAGERLFDVFPDNPSDLAADGVNNLYGSLRIAAETGKPHAMAIQRYDVRDANGVFRERYWRPLNTPILDDEGGLVFLLHHVEDVTEEVKRAALAAEPTTRER